MCTPSYPCRVGIIRKLRLDATLKKKPDGSWKIDLSKQRDGHKTSRFYGPFASSLPTELNDILEVCPSARARLDRSLPRRCHVVTSLPDSKRRSPQICC